ncbi:hypothetical protein ABPG75_004142 [Micractinium tetrahymenae]
MAVQRRPAARGAQGKQAGDRSAQPSSQKQAGSGGKAKHGPQPEVVPPASTLRAVLAAAALLLGLASAFSEWPIYLVYEKDLRRPAIAFGMNLGITAVIALAVMAKRQIIASLTLLMLALYFGFGLWGPSGAATAACLITFAYLALP